MKLRRPYPRPSDGDDGLSSKRSPSWYCYLKDTISVHELLLNESGRSYTGCQRQVFQSAISFHGNLFDVFLEHVSFMRDQFKLGFEQRNVVHLVVIVQLFASGWRSWLAWSSVAIGRIQAQIGLLTSRSEAWTQSLWRSSRIPTRSHIVHHLEVIISWLFKVQNDESPKVGLDQHRNDNWHGKEMTFRKVVKTP